MKKRRPYRMTRRAEAEERTRLRITESAVALHGTLGPSRSSITAIAEHAGVRRSTVYRHFPDEKALFAACSAHWMAANPLPDIARWAAFDDFSRRLDTALQELYPYYRRAEPMLTNVYRDEATMPVIRELMQGFRGFLAAAQDVLLQGHNRKAPRWRRVSALVGHVISFPVWRSLAIEQGLDDDECARLMSLLVQICTANRPPATTTAKPKAGNPSPRSRRTKKRRGAR